MECIEIIEDGKTYYPEPNTWLDETGNIFIKNEFNPKEIIWINISNDYWRAIDDKIYWLDWSNINLPIDIKQPFIRYLKSKLRYNSPNYLNSSRYALINISIYLKSHENNFSLLTLETFVRLWENMIPHYASWLREAYRWLTNHNEDGFKLSISHKLKSMKVRKNTRQLKDVLNWHPTKGALTQEEEILLRSSIVSNHYKNPETIGIRLYCWLLIATLKRGKQIRELRPDDFKKIEENKIEEYFVNIKPVKNQTGYPKAWWPIPKTLYTEIQRYSSIPSIKSLQKKHNRFWVMNCPSLRLNNIVDAAYGKEALRRHIKKDLKLISPRTKQLLHITPNRIRHTGATRLAYSGVSRDIIAEILEHDNPSSCNAYIDAIGSELCPSINRADRNMNSLFMKLNAAYFQGKIVNKLTDITIIIPDLSVSSPIFVGSCGRDTLKEDLCNKHPFIDCYNGCSHFLAWKEADHYRALIFANNELERWSKAHGHTKQIPTIKEYKTLKENILKVINCIKNIKK